jgi:hypothetical protein
MRSIKQFFYLLFALALMLTLGMSMIACTSDAPAEETTADPSVTADGATEAPTEDELEIIQNNVNAKLDAIYENVSSKYDISFEIEDTVLVRLSNGKYAMEYYVRADLVAKDTQAKITESTKLLVYLD